MFRRVVKGCRVIALRLGLTIYHYGRSIPANNIIYFPISTPTSLSVITVRFERHTFYDHSTRLCKPSINSAAVRDRPSRLEPRAVSFFSNRWLLRLFSIFTLVDNRIQTQIRSITIIYENFY